MTSLSPAPQSLGLSSPALGPWFADTSITLGLPNADLSVTLDNLSVNWQAPVTGLLSFRIASDPRPMDLARLRQADGSAAFTTGHLVAVLTLLPEVEARLTSLMNQIPALDGSTPSDAITRPPVRYLAMELLQPSTLATLLDLVDPEAVGDSDKKKANHLGFLFNNNTLSNHSQPVRDLKKVSQPLLTFQDRPTSVKLWTFDRWGRAIDPGAVATWWSHLATHVFDNLWHDSRNTRTVNATAHRSLHLVNAHGGPLTDDPVLDRLQTNNISGSGSLRTVETTDAANLSFSPPTPDTPNGAPTPKMALIPSGRYSDTVTLWPSGPVADASGNRLERDYGRVALVDMEFHLVGQRRTSDAADDTTDARRARDQRQVSTQVRIAQAAPLAPFPMALLSTTDEAADAAIATLSNPGNSQLVAGELERDWGGLDLNTLPDVAPPTVLPNPLVQALQGGGMAESGTLAKQQVLFSLALDASLQDAWIRVWPQGFDADVGRHTRLSGGSAKVRSDGTVSMVLTLPEGSVTTAAPLGVELLLLTAQGSQLFTDIRFERPTPVAGNALAWADIATDANIGLCEQGEIVARSALNDQVASGTTLYVDQTPPALINIETLPETVFRSDTLIRQITAGDRLQLTQSAFRSTPQGDNPSLLAATGATVQRQTRNGSNHLLTAGNPIPTMERLEIVAVQPNASCAIATTPALARYHELLPHQLGHPGAPAAVEIHGTGVGLSGPVVELLVEFSRDRTAGSTPNLITAATTPLSAPTITDPQLWAAPLRTVAAGIEAELNPTQLANLLNLGSPYPFGQGVAAVRTWLSGPGAALSSVISLPDSVNAAADSVVRALDRRLLAAARGLQEGATSLIAAIIRAEDFIYLETPAFDNLTFGNPDDQRSLITTLIQRLNERPALQLILCVPIDPLPGTPKALWRVRNALLFEALQNLRTAASNRLAIFSPNAGVGRTVRLASTTVVVDNAYVLTGTTHLWRRGLTFDASIAISLFDEQLKLGYPQEIQRFCRELLTERLGLPNAELLPDDPIERTQAIHQLTNRSGNRLAVQPIAVPDPDPSDTDKAMWNRDGSVTTGGVNPIAWLQNEIAAGQANEIIEHY